MFKARGTEKLLKAARGTGLTTVRLTAAFVSGIMESHRQCDSIFTVRKKNSQPRSPYPVKLFFKNKGEVKIVSDE